MKFGLEKLRRLPLSSVSGSEKNRFSCVWSDCELVVWLDHSRCSKWRPFAFTHACSSVCHWFRRWCPEEYGPKCLWVSASARQCRVMPPHLSYVSTLPDITQNRNTALTSWSRGSLTLGTVFLRASSTKPLANMAACMCKDKGRHFEHLLWSSPTTGSEPLETPQNQFFSEPLTLLRGRQHKFSVFM